jgi:hypothetical protein
MENQADIRLSFEEDEKETRATASLELRGERFGADGRARRSPEDPNVPLVGEELAAARALSALSHRLLEAAAARIEGFEGEQVQLRG